MHVYALLCMIGGSSWPMQYRKSDVLASASFAPRAGPALTARAVGPAPHTRPHCLARRTQDSRYFQPCRVAIFFLSCLTPSPPWSHTHLLPAPASLVAPAPFVLRRPGPRPGAGEARRHGRQDHSQHSRRCRPTPPHPTPPPPPPGNEVTNPPQQEGEIGVAKCLLMTSFAAGQRGHEPAGRGVSEMLFQRRPSSISK